MNKFKAKKELMAELAGKQITTFYKIWHCCEKSAYSVHE